MGELLLLYVHRLNAFRTASLSFRAAFSPEVAILQSPIRSNNTIGIYDTLKAGFARHHEAVITFRNSLPWCRVSAFDRAWQTHRHHQGFDPERLGFSDSENLSHLTEYLALNQEEEGLQESLRSAALSIYCLFRGVREFHPKSREPNNGMQGDGREAARA